VAQTHVGRKFSLGIPIFTVLANYRLSWLRGDILAGITACVVMIPSVIAYAELVHMPPITGIYAALAASLGYAIFASSRHVIAGPDAAIGLLAGMAILPLAAGDPSRIPALAATLAIMSGLVLIVASRLKVGVIADFLSRPVLIGYLNGASLILASTQLGKLFGVSTEGESFFPLLWQVINQLPQTHTPTFLFGMAMILMLILMNKQMPRIPSALVVSAIGILATQFMGLEAMGVKLVGEVPSGIPELAIPQLHWSDISALAPAAVAIAFLAFSDGILLAQVFANKNRYEINPNSELNALGFSNVAAGLLQGFPVSASQSRTSIVDATGGKTQVAQLIAAGGLLLSLFFLTELIGMLPKVTLGAILIVTGIGMLEIAALRDLFRMDRFEFFISMAVTSAILIAGVVPGIVFGLLISLGGVIVEFARPQDAILRRARAGGKFQDLGIIRPGSKASKMLMPMPEGLSGEGEQTQVIGETVPGLLIYRLYGPLIFANARYVIDRLVNLVEQSDPPVRWIIIDAQAITDMDITAAQRFADLHRKFEEAGIDIKFADATRPLMAQLQKVGLSSAMGTQEFYVSVKKAVEAYERIQYPLRKIRLVVQRGDEEPCELIFQRQGSNMSASCSCQQTDQTTLCSHRLTLLHGELGDMRLLEGDEHDLERIPLMVAGTDVDEALKALEAAQEMMEEANQDYREAKALMIDAIKD
jgi:SulP family sulfate permease